MKIKDLLQFNPEAELQLLGMDYIPIELSIYGWSSPDTNEDTKNITNTFFNTSLKYANLEIID